MARTELIEVAVLVAMVDARLSQSATTAVSYHPQSVEKMGDERGKLLHAAAFGEPEFDGGYASNDVAPAHAGQ